jgi:hypothetical protein
MAQPAPVRAWWADLDELREQIERRHASAPVRPRELRELRGVAPLMEFGSARQRERRAELDESTGVGSSASARRRSSPRRRLAGPRPDLFAAWAVWLSLALLAVALLSTHG